MYRVKLNWEGNYSIADDSTPYESALREMFLNREGKGCAVPNTGYWKTKQEAETFLKGWRLKKMTPQEIKTKIEQAKVDKESMETNIKMLEKQLKSNISGTPTSKKDHFVQKI